MWPRLNRVVRAFTTIDSLDEQIRITSASIGRQV